MNRLSKPLSKLQAHYDVVVVGSGYGGAITAARLAGQRKEEGRGEQVKVAVLERGREVQPGDFPRRFSEVVGQTQLQIRSRQLGSPVGLYDVRVDRDIAVLQGCGLGGGSLINANVVLEPSAEVRGAGEWPPGLDLLDPSWNQRFCRVRDRLHARPYPDPTLPVALGGPAEQAVGGGAGNGRQPPVAAKAPGLPPAAEGLDPRRWPRLPKLLALDEAGRALGHAAPPAWNEMCGDATALLTEELGLMEEELKGPLTERVRGLVQEFGRLHDVDTEQLIDEATLVSIGPVTGAALLALLATRLPPRAPLRSALQRAPQGAPPLSIRVPDIAVSFEPHVSIGGVRQRPCTLCGDCVTGCNYAAKNTLPMNYLAMAQQYGADIFCETAVHGIERVGARADGHWLLRLQPLDARRHLYRPPAMWVTADVVVLAAGSLGSTELLLRSSKGYGGSLDLSPMLGKRFSGNGDVIAWGYNNAVSVNGFGAGRKAPGERGATGPTITGVIDLRECDALEDQVIIEDGAIPGALAWPARILLTWFGWIGAVRTSSGWQNWFREVARGLTGALFGVTRGALRNTQTYLINAHDGGGPSEGLGWMGLQNGRLRITWPEVGAKHVYQRINQLVLGATAALEGRHVINPMWSRRRRRLITVHPLGGCAMGSDWEHGVVDHRGRVFDPCGEGETSYHPWLFVNDGAVVPRSVGANPLLTISAIAERNADCLAQTRGWARAERTFEQEPKGSVTRPGFRFSEKLVGWVEPSDRAPFELRRGKMEAVLTIDSDDLWAFTRQGKHKAALYGTVTWPCEHGTETLTAVGWFQLFDEDFDRVELLKMRYVFELRSESGEVYCLDGRKSIYDEPGVPDLWPDISRLRYELRRKDEDDVDLYKADGPIIATGHLRLPVGQLFNLIRSARVTNATSRWRDLAGRIRVAWFYARVMIQQFAWPIRRSDVANPYRPHGRIPTLRAAAQPCADDQIDHGHEFPSGAKLLHCKEKRAWVQAADGAVITLTRHKGDGRHGPVILAPGFGTSTLAFTISTNDRLSGKNGVDPRLDPEALGITQTRRSFVDFLVDRHGYDVWLLDYRASERSEAAGTQFTLDDVAKYDWPAAVETVLFLRNQEEKANGWQDRTKSVQVLAHCVGSLSLLMSRLGGHLDDGVRSIACSQSLTHLDQPWVNRFKARIHLATLLKWVGGWPTYNPDFDVRSGGAHRVVDALLRALPWERCRNPVCRRIQFLYGSVNRHEQLNAMTHNAMHEMFNEANTRTFRHLSKMIRAGQLVAADGSNRYLTKEGAARLRLPVGLIQGEANPIFRPRGLEWSYEWIVSHAEKHAQALPDGICWHEEAEQGRGLVRKVLIEGTRAGEDRWVRDRYGHMDCFIGRNCWHDSFPTMVAELQRADRAAARLTGMPVPNSEDPLDRAWEIELA